MELLNRTLKNDYRLEFKQKRDFFFANASGAQIAERLAFQMSTLLPELAGRLRWASYKSTQSEANPEVIEAQNSEFTWCHPVVAGDALDFYEVKGQWALNRYQIHEPNPATSRKIKLQDLDGVLVPGLAFDLKGNRLGWGKAYYDRTLQNFSGIKIGIAYSVQITTESLPVSDHDIPMDYIVTENEVLKIHSLEEEVS